MIGTLKAATYIGVAIAVSLLLLTFSSGGDISATDYETAYSSTLSDSTAHANSDSVSPFNAETGAQNANWLVLRNTTSSTAFLPVMDHQIPDGAGVGKVDFTVTLGLINGPCNNDIPGSIPMLEATTDIFDTADFEGTGHNLLMDDDADGTVEAEDSNGLPTYVDHYPSFLNLMFDPDGAGTKLPIRPRARYIGHQEVVDGVAPTILQLVIFNPGDLGDSAKGMPEPDAAMSDAFGFPVFVIVNNPTAAAAPTAITDWCATNSDTRLLGLTEGRWSVIDGPEPVEFDRGGHCAGAQKGVDNDGDGVIDDGCLFLDTGTDAGIVRTENPAPGTGIYGTGTHLVRSYSQSYRDADGDGIANDLDPCTVTVDTGVDVDADGIDDSCDINTAIGSSPPTAVDNGFDDDGDWVPPYDPTAPEDGGATCGDNEDNSGVGAPDGSADAGDPDCHDTPGAYDGTLSEDGAGANTCSDATDNGSADGADTEDIDCYTGFVSSYNASLVEDSVNNGDGSDGTNFSEDDTANNPCTSNTGAASTAECGTADACVGAGDGVDDDSDGSIDEGCTNSCSDGGVDNGGEGDADTADADCRAGGGETSDDCDQTDTDGDTIVDDGACIDEDPFDTKDNDGDGLVDEDGGCAGVQGLPDADQDCYPNRGDNCAQLPNDGRDLDLTIPSGPAPDFGMNWDNIGDDCDASGPVPEAGGQCANATDDDGDGRANDGCPIAPAPPNAFFDAQNFEDPQVFPSVNGSAGLGSCTDGVDNGGLADGFDATDTDCYDGQEWGPQCQNFTDDDGDTVVNDGCPAAGGGVASGHYHTIVITNYVCIGELDTDGDGVCDSTEDLLGSLKNDNTSIPEYAGLEYDNLKADNNGDTVPDDARGPCNNFLVDGHPATVPVDEDGDTNANGADTGCQSHPVVGNPPDTDGDGVGDDVDNCDNDDNPGQQDTDGDGLGDDCDLDDDGDGVKDTAESYMGTDPKDNCRDDNKDDAFPSDANKDGSVLVNDIIILFLGRVFATVGTPAYQARSDANADGKLLVNDIIILFLGKVFMQCDKNLPPANLTALNSSGNPAGNVALHFSSRVISIDRITDNGPEDGGSTCDDGVDNAGDVSRDIQDPDCYDTPGVYDGTNVEDGGSTCGDGVDNSGVGSPDGSADSADPECYDTPGVYDATNAEDGVAAACGDGNDNGDLDGADTEDVDCYDGIAGYNASLVEDSVSNTCNDTLDNDADGADADDIDCYDGIAGYNTALVEDGISNNCNDGLDNDADGADFDDPECGWTVTGGIGTNVITATRNAGSLFNGGLVTVPDVNATRTPLIRSAVFTP